MAYGVGVGVKGKDGVEVDWEMHVEMREG